MATFDKTIQELTKLKAVTRPRQQGSEDIKLQFAAMARGLADIPSDALESGCSAWANSSQWFPTLAELRGECRQFVVPPKRRALPPPGRSMISERERLRNAWGFRRIMDLMRSDAPPEEWDKLRADMNRMRAEESTP